MKLFLANEVNKTNPDKVKLSDSECYAEKEVMIENLHCKKINAAKPDDLTVSLFKRWVRVLMLSLRSPLSGSTAIELRHTCRLKKENFSKRPKQPTAHNPKNEEQCVVHPK